MRDGLAPPPALPEPRTPPYAPAETPVEPPSSSFGLNGSYAHVGILTSPDLQGAKALHVVDYPLRLEEVPYQELSLFYKDRLAEMPVLVRTTLASREHLYQYTGQFDAQLALRELYVEVEPTPRLSLWLGSRLYRGDNIYIFDVWPTEFQRTLGGGAAFKVSEDQLLQAHIGLYRIIDNNFFFQYQTIDVPQPSGIGAQPEVFLDRNRGVVSLTYTHHLPFGLKWKMHGEGHYLPSGARRLANGTDQHLPADHGFLLGTEVEECFDPSFVRFFVKYARGLAAYDPLAVPFGFAPDLTITESERILVGLGETIDTHWFGMHYGAYWQRFTDSTGTPDLNDQDQFAVAAQPEVYLGDYVRAGLSLSWQGARPKGPFPETGRTEFPTITALHFLVGVAPGRGPFVRPVLYAIYGLHWLNEAARIQVGRGLGAEPHAREDLVGLVAEWWF
jgi:maltoporin